MSAITEDVEIELYAGVIEQNLNSQEEFSREDAEIYDDAIMNCGGVDDVESGVDDNGTKDLTLGNGEAERLNSTEGDKVEAQPVRKYQMCIGNLTWWTSDKIIEDTLNDIGVKDLLDIKFYAERVNGQSKGYCVVTVGSEESLRIIQDTLPRGKIEGNVPIVVPPTKQALAELDAKAKTRSYAVNHGNLGNPNMSMMGPRGSVGPVWDHPTAGYDPRMMMMGPAPMRAVGPTSPPMGAAPPHRNMGPRQGPPSSNGFAPLPRPPMGSPPAGPPPQRMRYRNSMMMMPQQHPNMPPRGPIHHQPPPPMMDPRGPPPPGDWNCPPMNPSYHHPPTPAPPGPGVPMQGSPPPPPQPRMINGPPLLPPGTLAPHFNPRFLSPPGPLGPQQQVCLRPPLEYLPPPTAPPQQPANNYIHPPAEHRAPITEAEFEEILSRNRAVSTSAIARAVMDAEAGDFAGAIETLVTAISLIKQSKIAHDDRCKVLITMLQETLEGVENKTYGRSRSRSRSRSRARYMGRSWSRRERSRSRNRSRERYARNRSKSPRESMRRERDRSSELEPPERSDSRRSSRH